MPWPGSMRPGCKVPGGAAIAAVADTGMSMEGVSGSVCPRSSCWDAERCIPAEDCASGAVCPMPAGALEAPEPNAVDIPECYLQATGICKRHQGPVRGIARFQQQNWSYWCCSTGATALPPQHHTPYYLCYRMRHLRCPAPYPV